MFKTFRGIGSVTNSTIDYICTLNRIVFEQLYFYIH